MYTWTSIGWVRKLKSINKGAVPLSLFRFNDTVPTLLGRLKYGNINMDTSFVFILAFAIGNCTKFCMYKLNCISGHIVLVEYPSAKAILETVNPCPINALSELNGPSPVLWYKFIDSSVIFCDESNTIEESFTIIWIGTKGWSINEWPTGKFTFGIICWRKLLLLYVKLQILDLFQES